MSPIRMSPIRPDVHERFVRLVARAIARADREQREHLERLRQSRAPLTRPRTRFGAGRAG